MGLYGVVVVLGPTIGPLLGGWLVTNYDWHWIFFINVPIGLAGSLMVAAVVHDPPYIKARHVTADPTGMLVMSVGLTSLLVVLEQGNRWDWFRSSCGSSWGRPIRPWTSASSRTGPSPPGRCS